MKDTDQKLIDKIRNLLNMTVERGCSEAEAASAARLASKLMEQHSLTMSEITEEDRSGVTEVEADPNVPFGTAQVWTQNIAVVLSLLFGVYVIKSTRGMGKITYRFFGPAVDVTVASDVFVWVCEQGKRLAGVRADQHRNQSASFRASYLAGYADGIVHQAQVAIAEREKAERADATQGSGKYGAIVRHNAQEAKQYATEKYETRQDRSRAPSVTNLVAAMTGLKDGANTPLQRVRPLNG